MRVLLWTNLFWPYVGGVETVSALLVERLIQEGHQVEVVTSHDYLDLPDREERQGAIVHRVPMLQALRGDPLLLTTCRRAIAEIKRAFQPQLIHANDLGAGLAFYLQTEKVSPCPLLLSLQQSLFTQDQNSLSARIIARADRISSVSRHALSQALELVPSARPRSLVIPNFARAPRQQPPPLPWPARVLMLGRMVEQKGFDLGLRAWPAVQASFPEARLVLAGDGPERQSLESLSVELQISDGVDFAGWVDPENVYPTFFASTLVCLPSRWEGLPVTAVQASLAGRPLVVTQVGGNAEIVAAEETGLVVPPGVTEIGEAICQLLSQPDRAQALGQAARQRALQLFEEEACLQAYLQLYGEMAQAWNSR